MKRGYLLPDGCKDLIDALKLKAQGEPQHSPPQPAAPAPLPPIVGEIVVPEHSSALVLARLLGRKPFQIIAELMHFVVFATFKQPLDYDSISKVSRNYGFIAKRAA